MTSTPASPTEPSPPAEPSGEPWAGPSAGRCDVLVVGGGPAGLLLAILLRQRGVDVVVLERRRHPSTHSRAIGLHPPALAALAAVGLDEAAIDRGARIVRGAARSQGHHLGSLSFERSWPGRPYVLSLPQSLTEELLTRHLAQLAPAALHRGVDVVALWDRGEDVQVVTQRTPQQTTMRSPRPTTQETGPGRAPGQNLPDARAADAASDGTAWCARVVVGADGARSTVRALAGIRTGLRTYLDTYLMGDMRDMGELAQGAAPADARASRAHRSARSDRSRRSAPSDRTAESGRTATIHLHPDGVVESFPLPGGGRRWVAHTGTASAPTASPAEPADPDDLAALVRRRTGTRIDPSTTTMISAFTVQRRSARTLVRGRLVLIGDAAHEISPIGGQGITLGWLDALALAPLLEQVVTRDLRHPLTTMPLLQRFDRSRRRAARTAGLLAELNMMLGRPRSAPVARGRDAVIRAVLSTPLRHRMAWAYSMGWATIRRS